MRAAIYNPYLDSLGGGERYSMAIATTLVKNGYIVDVEWKSQEIKDKLEERFGIDLKNVNFIDNINRGDGYDICFWVSDGSIPALKARRNFLHFQVPFQKVSGRSLINKVKLMRVSKVIVNSLFTKKIIDQEFGVDSFVLYPPVATEEFRAKKKEDLILNVSRFSQLMQAKRQDILIKTFSAFYKANPDYKLVLAGGAEVGADKFIDELKEEINKEGKLPVTIIKSPDFKTIKDLYGRAKFFWSASGFGIDDIKEPKKVEHFGIAPVEAMAAGCVPILVNKGGHKEIVEEGVNGYLWNDPGDLYGFTKKLTVDEKLRREISKNAIERAKKFSYEEFEKTFSSIC